MIFTGSMTAIVTPFKKGKVDEEKFKELIELQIENGTKGIVPCGTTGESATLTHQEHKHVIDIAIKQAKGRVPIIAGTGSNSTNETIMLTKYAKEAGADAALLITPYYNKPTQSGLIAHYTEIAKNVNIPIVLYNVPGRTAVNMEPETVAKLSEIKNIVAVKEASGNLGQISKIISLCNIIVLSGDDALTLPILSIGGKGVISVAANIAPKDMAEMMSAFEQGDLIKTRRLHYKLLPLFKAIFIETNPIPVKTALGMMGIINGELRLPLTPMSNENKEKLKKVLEQTGLLTSVNPHTNS